MVTTQVDDMTPTERIEEAVTSSRRWLGLWTPTLALMLAAGIVVLAPAPLGSIGAALLVLGSRRL
jgi:hypothetical protein